MSKKARPTTILRRGMRLANRVEEAVDMSKVRKHVQLVTLAFLIRNRRLANAIGRLGSEHAYESRLLVRSMVETMINHAWIRLRRPHSRATRFIAFRPLELLRVHQWLHTTMKKEDFKAAKRTLVRQRARVRHLFRNRDKKGRLYWARDWAEASSVERRLDEVQRSENPSKPDPFLYGIFSQFSSATHGGPTSVNDLFQAIDGRPAICPQPEKNPEGHIVAAAAVMSFSLEAAVEDLKLSVEFSRNVERYAEAVKGLKGAKQAA